MQNYIFLFNYVTGTGVFFSIIPSQYHILLPSVHSGTDIIDKSQTYVPLSGVGRHIAARRYRICPKVLTIQT